ncbi:MAG: hypothetical protein EPN72_05185 [Nevskiaceae bacterium]|nr:MAG: hypothetical protein EPN63_04010 [Nevskiaceae bacterium]TBR73533.1 MAG: hypothetical protein EPN72_05185 [Nevskiaceae bacterium]
MCNPRLSGMLDDYNAWLDTGDATARAIIERRRVGYVLACNDVEQSLVAKHGKPTLAQRLAKGDSPNWLKTVPWPKSVHANFKLYRVVSTDTETTK